MIDVVIADDQELVREGLRNVLAAEADITVVGEAADGADALDLVQQHDPDVLVADIRMPRLDGIQTTRRLTDASSRTRVLILTTFDLDKYVYLALKAGASGFLLKNATRADLTSAVRTVARRETLLAPTITKRLIEDYCSRPEPATDQPDAVLADLSAREREVFLLVARGMSNAEIAHDLYLSDTTVKSHVARILAKLDLRDRIQAVVLAYETGLIRPSGTTGRPPA